ncbi:LamG-like jellyroll fold domain-containing protein [Botrimarina hoheduenensis]|nr:LamG-like jellyroll fold domain-containing protein [Botrimarina hoheduenensis]
MVTASTSSALDLVQGYEKGVNRLDQLGAAFVFDEAMTGGGDATATSAPSSFGWVAQYTDLWDVGTAVSLTGVAIPLHAQGSAGSSSTQNGDWTFTFFELDGGANPNAFDGYDFATTTGETVLGSVTATYTFNPLGPDNQTDEYFVAFDSPINFTSASSGLAFHMQSTNTMRVKVNTPGATRRADRVSLANGTPVAGTNSSFAATIAGTPVAFPPPPPPTVSHRVNAAIETPGNRVWETLAPSQEQYAFTFPQSGDYNGDGLTDIADYTVWRDNLAGDADLAFAAGSRSTSNSGAVNQVDYNYWVSNFGEPASMPVNDPSVPGITRAFRQGAIGQANVYENQVNGVQASRQDGSFEIWFKPDSLAGAGQVLFEIGGSGMGSYLSLDGDTLSFYVKGQFSGNEQTLTTSLSNSDWTQVAVVIHNTFSPDLPSPDDYVDLYVDGVLAATTALSPTDINRWAGGNQGAIGLDGGVIAEGGPLTGDTINVVEFPFLGEIAIFEYATTAWNSSEVLSRYNAITSATSVAVPEPAAAMMMTLLLGMAASRRGYVRS